MISNIYLLLLLKTTTFSSKIIYIMINLVPTLSQIAQIFLINLFTVCIKVLNDLSPVLLNQATQLYKVNLDMKHFG